MRRVPHICICVQKREEAEGASESNRVVCSANDARRRDDFLPGTKNETRKFLTKKLADSLTDTSRFAYNTILFIRHSIDNLKFDKKTSYNVCVIQT